MTSPLLTVVRSLSFAKDRTDDLKVFSERDWERLLPLCDKTHLTLPIGVRALHRLPEGPRQRIERNLARNKLRYARGVESYQHIAAALCKEGVEFVILKGLSQWRFCSSLEHRPQYDHDFYCPPDSIEQALAAITNLGYETFRGTSATLDHLPPLIRRTGWRWNGDYFDPEMPFTVELHHRFWDRKTERFHSVSTNTLWYRRVQETHAGVEFPALSSHDRLSYSTWHLVRHLLRGDLRPYHVYEIAHFLHATADDNTWWMAWAQDQGQSSLEIAGIAFSLAHSWFDCSMDAEPRRVVQQLSPRIRQWLDAFDYSPLTAWEHPNKDELLLHLSLVSSLQDKLLVLRRRLVPVRFQIPVLDPHVPRTGMWLGFRHKLSTVRFLAQRTIHHLQAIGSAARSALRWTLHQRLQSHRKLRAGNVVQ